MKVRELLSVDELTACRAKATQKVNRLLSDAFAKHTKEDGSIDEIPFFETLAMQFKLTAQCTAACAENFDPQLFRERGNNRKPVEELKIMRMGQVTGTQMMEDLCDAIAGQPLSRVNGTSIRFGEFAKMTGIEIERLNRGGEAYKPKALSANYQPSEIVFDRALAYK